MQPNAIKNISSLHIYGVQDVLINNDRTLKLAEAFENPLIVAHQGGHFTPNSWPNEEIKQFLIKQQNRHITPSNDPIQFQSLNTFEEKLEAIIVSHQKRKQLPVISTDDTLDNAMLRIWCERTTFHRSEPKDTASSFFKQWILLYLQKPEEVLLSYLNHIPKYGSWGDVKTLYSVANQMETPLLEKLKEACVKMFADQLKHDQRIVLNQPDESANEQEEQLTIKSQEWISNCAKEAPRITHSRENPSNGIHLIFILFFCIIIYFSDGETNREIYASYSFFANENREAIECR